MGMEWLFGFFGDRKLIDCKESQLGPDGQTWVANGYPVQPSRLIVDKQLDYANIQPRSIVEETGSLQAMSTWGRPMDRATGLIAPALTTMSPEMLPTLYYDSQREDGTPTSVPLGVGSIVRAIAADTIADVRRGRTRYSK